MNGIIAGFGFRQSAGVDSLLDAYQRACARAGQVRLLAIAGPHDKASAICLTSLSRTLGLDVIAVAHEDQLRVTTATQSIQSQTQRGVGSVAEAVALAAVSEPATLLVRRQISLDRRATCALAIPKPTCEGTHR